MKAKKEPVKTAIKRSPFAFFLPSLMIGIMLAVVLIKPDGIKTRTRNTLDEILYNFLGDQVSMNTANYNTKLYYNIATSKGAVLPEYMNEPLFKHPPAYALLLSIPKRLGMRTFGQANYFSFYLACLLIPLVFFMARQLYDDRVAFLAFIFMSIEPVYWLCSLHVWMECHIALFMYLAFFAFILGWKNDNYYYLSGVFTGLAMLTKYPGVLVMPIIFIYAVFCRSELLKNLKFYAIFIIGFLIFSPWLLWNIKVYGAILPSLQLHNDTAFMSRTLGNIKKPVFLIIAASCLAALWFTAFKGYIQKTVEKIGSVKLIPLLIAVICLGSVVFLKSVRGGLVDTFFLTKLPPVTADYPNIFASQPWFYLGQLIKMSPIFIISYLSVLFLGSRSDSDRFLLITAFIVMVFYLKWGNYQSRYVASAIPAMLILAARALIWLWDVMQNADIRVKNAFKCVLICLVSYFIIKTLIVDIRLTSLFFGKDTFFAYF